MLKEELYKLREEHGKRNKSRKKTEPNESVVVAPVCCKREVKRVTYQQVRVIGEGIGYLMALRGISEQQLGDYFNAETHA